MDPGEVMRDRFPDLFAESYVDHASARITYVDAAAPDELVTRLHLVALTDVGDVVVCRSTQGWRFLPGGTREPGETLSDLARRELLEEAGATLRGDIVHYAAHHADSDLPRLFTRAQRIALGLRDGGSGCAGRAAVRLFGRPFRRTSSHAVHLGDSRDVIRTEQPVAPSA